MINILPFIPSDGNNRFSTTLEEVQFTFDVRWNVRADAWYFDMYDADGVVMVSGIKIVLGAYLGRQSAHPWFEENILIAVDASGEEREPGFDDLGTRVQVRHYPVNALISELIG